MALSFSFPSSKSDQSSQNIFSNDVDQDKSNVTDRSCQSEGSEGVENSHQKLWKSTPSLHLNKGNSSTTVARNSEQHVRESSQQQLHSNKTGSSCSINSSSSSRSTGGSFIPVPRKRTAQGKAELTLENLTNDGFTNESGNTKGLPDVTESPQTPFSSEKPCDLLAQLEIVKKQREMERNCVMMDSSTTGESDSVDDNGNPVEVVDVNNSDTDESENKIVEGDEEELKTEGMEENSGTQSNTPKNEPSEKASASVSAADGILEDLEKSSKKLLIDIKSPDEPKYFINAAALSEDTFELPPSPAPSPCSSQFNSLNFIDPYPSLCPFVPDRSVEVIDGSMVSSEKKRQPTEKSGNEVAKFRQDDKSEKASANLKEESSTSVRSRVPVSKSFPDIVQTTFGSSESNELHKLSDKAKDKDNSDTESLVADSLEELRQVVPDDVSEPFLSKVVQEQSTSQEADKPLKAFEQPLSSYGFDGMTESQMGGILAEKPPEAWVIDFSSLSLESELTESSNRERKSSMGSNPSSLAFFVNLEDKSEASTSAAAAKEIMERSSTPDKKIFTMFVDIGQKDDGGISNIPQCQIKSSDSESLMSASMTMGSKRGIINKPVLNIMETSGCGMKYPINRRFPSPIFQHRAAAEASRKAAKMEFHKQREKQQHKEQFLDSLEPHSAAAFMNKNEGDIMIKSQLGDSTSSNRSSLHVANVLDASFTSSLLSSMENSSPADMEVCQGGPCFKLGKDLLRMFQEGINTDVNIMVHGKCIKAHKCILASRSQYFAAILSGNWVENAGNTINLDGFSYTVVQFTMYHIYSGTNEIPDTIDLLELATLTDLLGLEGLRENISQTIRAKFCHNFHRPCTGCIAGVIECFPIAIAYGMDELHRKMTKWICKHFVRIWPTKAFANLGDELIEKCLRYSVNHLSVDNILDHTLGCDQLLTTMPTVRWTEAIFSIVGQLSEACVQYIGEHFCEVLQAEKFLLFGKGQTWNISRIEGTFMEALNLLKPDEACLSHTALSRLIELGTETIDEVEWSTVAKHFVK